MIYGIFVDIKGNVNCKPLKIGILWFVAFLLMLKVMLVGSFWKYRNIMIYGIFVDVSCKPLKIMILWFMAFLFMLKVMLVVGP
jgi:hypothetical protein